MTDLIVLQAKFWEFRQMMAPHWFIPETLDAARFAVTEAAEVLKTNGMWEAFVAFAASRQAQITAADALDAVLRRNASYSRNTVRNMDEIDELGDLAMMLLTAMGPQPIVDKELDVIRHRKETTTIDDIVDMTSYVHNAAINYPSQLSTLRSYALRALNKIDHYPGMDLNMVLHSRMARIYRKHHPDAAGRSFTVSDGVAYRNETPATYTTLSGGIL